MAYNLRPRTTVNCCVNKKVAAPVFTMVLRSSVSASKKVEKVEKEQTEILECAKALVSLRQKTHNYFLRSR